MLPISCKILAQKWFFSMNYYTLNVNLIIFHSTRSNFYFYYMQGDSPITIDENNLLFIEPLNLTYFLSSKYHDHIHINYKVNYNNKVMIN